MLADIYADVEKVAASIVPQAGLELVQLTVDQRQTVYMIEILADRPQGGITLAECAHLNKKIAQEFDLFQPWAGNYELVVASPGLDRPLRDEKDFRRVLGKRVKIVLIQKVAGKGEHFGTVKQVAEDAVVIALKKEDLRILFVNILKATLVI